MLLQEQEFYDYKTAPVVGKDVIDLHRTGISYYDDFLSRDTYTLNYLKNEKNLVGTVVKMSPDEYYQACSEYGFINSNPSVEKLKLERRRDEKTLQHLRDVLTIFKRRFPMPMLNKAANSQEGLHRMMVVGDMFGWDYKVPVLVVDWADKQKAYETAKRKRIERIEYNIKRAVIDALLYKFTNIDELREQIQWELDKQFEYSSDIDTPVQFELTSDESCKCFIVSIGAASYEFDYDDVKFIDVTDDLDVDDIELDDVEDFLSRHFGDDWRNTHPHLKDTFNIKEDLTTKTVRRDNPNDFSPFGYKVDFYDGDNHIGEGSVCGIKDDNAFLYDFEVYPEFRGKGYSKEMLQYLIDQYDLKQLFVKPDNNVAINLYKKYGFDFDDDYFGDSDSGNMRLMIRESLENNRLYFISTKDLDGKTLQPRVPDNYFTKRGYEDGETPRVCFAPSIDQCLMAISQKCDGMEFYVYSPIAVDKNCLYKPSTKEVPDSTITGETWITCPVKIKKIGKIKVLGDSGLDGHPFNYGDKTAELYDWDWEWVSSDLKEDLHVDSINSPEELMDWMNSNITYELVDDEYSNSNDVPTKTAEEVLETKKGHCAEQSYLEKEILDGLGYKSFLVMVKENNSKKEYGAEGSAHVFLVYKDEKDNYCWFEHSMQHARGIHKYTSLEALLQDVANQWWRYDKNSDILEVRMIDKYITGVDNWGLAKECYKYPVKYTFDISNNIMESDVPLEESFSDVSSIKEMDKIIQQNWAFGTPGEGCIFIAPNGKFINIYPMLDDHEDLCYWLEENGFEDNPKDAEWFVDTFGYIRCRNSLHLCFVDLPKNITNKQLYSLEEWFDTKVKSSSIQIAVPEGKWKKFNLDNYFPEDIIKIIRRYYSSGTLYD